MFSVNFFLFLSLVFLFTFLVGRLIEKVRIPWIFAPLLLGVLLAVHNPFVAITETDSFVFLAQLGMYFLLFMIGVEIDLNKFKKVSFFIFRATFVIIFLEAFFGGLFVHYVFHLEWLISFIVSLSFATVGEAMLIPILEEFKIVNTRLGQSIIGVGVLDNLIEMILLMVVMFITGAHVSGGEVSNNFFFVLAMLSSLFALTYLISKARDTVQKFVHFPVEVLFLFSLFIFFLYIGIGEYSDATPIAALLAGIAIKAFVPEGRLKAIDSEIKVMCYGFFAPIFFLWVGSTVDINFLFTAPLLIFLVVLVSNGAKMLGSYIVGKKELGTKESILLGLGLSVRFSTSIVIMKILYENGVIDVNLYSILIASSIVFKFIIPVLFSRLIVLWGVKEST